jgi:hypothetical protein
MKDVSQRLKASKLKAAEETFKRGHEDGRL